MAHVPIEDIMEHIDSKYRLVIVAAKRAKQLNRGAAPLVQVRNVKPTYQALEEVATGKLSYEVENLAGEATRELEPGGKPTWYRSLSAEEVVPEEVVAEAEERFEEEEVPVEAPIAGGAAEDLLMNEFEEEGLDELGDLEVIESEETEE
jgi:DNA-directed RNA polymerase subunit omega